MSMILLIDIYMVNGQFMVYHKKKIFYLHKLTINLKIMQIKL